ncbi:MAG: hypothetical protein AWU57_575 [Marinobacter sp. T13-3]|nr:MAG: hypothetical protein AWU57_575 [Marinobacter sp. T13-3]
MIVHRIDFETKHPSGVWASHAAYRTTMKAAKEFRREVIEENQREIEHEPDQIRPGHGYTTHAVPANSALTTALCGVQPDEGNGGEISDGSLPTCMRCRKALKRLGRL